MSKSLKKQVFINIINPRMRVVSHRVWNRIWVIAFRRVQIRNVIKKELQFYFKLQDIRNE
jgi:hypothetical protein